MPYDSQNYQNMKFLKNEVTQAIELGRKGESKYLAVAVSSIIARTLPSKSGRLGRELGLISLVSRMKSDQVVVKLSRRLRDYCANSILKTQKS